MRCCAINEKNVQGAFCGGFDVVFHLVFTLHAKFHINVYNI